MFQLKAIKCRFLDVSETIHLFLLRYTVVSVSIVTFVPSFVFVPIYCQLCRFTVGSLSEFTVGTVSIHHCFCVNSLSFLGQFFFVSASGHCHVRVISLFPNQFTVVSVSIYRHFGIFLLSVQ